MNDREIAPLTAIKASLEARAEARARQRRSDQFWTTVVFALVTSEAMLLGFLAALVVLS